METNNKNYFSQWTDEELDAIIVAYEFITKQPTTKKILRGYNMLDSQSIFMFLSLTKDVVDKIFNESVAFYHNKVDNGEEFDPTELAKVLNNKSQLNDSIYEKTEETIQESSNSNSLNDILTYLYKGKTIEENDKTPNDEPPML